MAQLPDRMTTIIVSALRRDTAAVHETLGSANNSVNKEGPKEGPDEWIVDALRPTRSLRSTASLIGSFVLNRVVSLLEDLFESVQSHTLLFDDEDVPNAAMFLLAAIESYIDNIEVGYDCANAWPMHATTALKTCPTFRTLR